MQKKKYIIIAFLILALIITIYTLVEIFKNKDSLLFPIHEMHVVTCNIKDKEKCIFLHPKAAQFALEYNGRTSKNKGEIIVGSNISSRVNSKKCDRYDLKKDDICINRGIVYPLLKSNILKNIVLLHRVQPSNSMEVTIDNSMFSLELYYVLYQENRETYLLEAYIPAKKGKLHYKEQLKNNKTINAIMKRIVGLI